MAGAFGGNRLEPMLLSELTGFDGPPVTVSGLAYSSRAVRPGTLFFCVRGFNADGHDFAPEAVAGGASALVCERSLGLGVPELIVPDVRAAMGPLAARFHRYPSRRLAVCGITGTNGKTTTAFLVRDLLEASGTQTGMLGTVKSVVGGVEEPVQRTTPEAIDIQESLHRMVETGDLAAAIEVSSHALALGRTDGVEFRCRVFTNLTPEHMDFHSTMEDYYLAKRKLFDSPGPAIVNLDDPYGERLAGELDVVTTFGIDSAAADYRAVDVSFDWSGSRFRCLALDGTVEVRTRLPGRFNVLNALGAIAAAVELGAELAEAAAALAQAERVPGRFEPIDVGQDFGVLVDYAHTPDSVENVLRAARELAEGQLHVVLGAGGDRDRAKRPLMGAAAGALADRVIVTSDNPRSEDPAAIVAEVLAGVPGGAEREIDRRAAIELALSTARPGDIVVVAGKGHEQGQEFEGGRIQPFDDRAVVREVLRGLAGAERQSPYSPR